MPIQVSTHVPPPRHRMRGRSPATAGVRRKDDGASVDRRTDSHDSRTHEQEDHSVLLFV